MRRGGLGLFFLIFLSCNKLYTAEQGLISTGEFFAQDKERSEVIGGFRDRRERFSKSKLIQLDKDESNENGSYAAIIQQSDHDSLAGIMISTLQAGVDHFSRFGRHYEVIDTKNCFGRANLDAQ